MNEHCSTSCSSSGTSVSSNQSHSTRMNIIGNSIDLSANLQQAKAASGPQQQSALGNASGTGSAFAIESQNTAKNKKLFPKKLWDLINNEKYYFCLRWSEDGQLVYLNRDEFEESYLRTPENQFHTQKAISFVRQMNMYGFRKVDDCYYENDNFKRDCEHLLKNMTRKHPNKNHQLPHHYQHQHHHHHHQSLNRHLAQQQQQQHDESSLLAPKQTLFSEPGPQNAVLDGLQRSSGVTPLANTSDQQQQQQHSSSDLSAFYALLSSLSNSLYNCQQPASPLTNYQAANSLLLEAPIAKFSPAASSPQQIYQSLMAHQQQDNTLSSISCSANSLQHPQHRDSAQAAAAPITKDLFTYNSSSTTPTLMLSSQNLLDRMTSATSRLAPSTASSSSHNIANDLSLRGNHLRGCGNKLHAALDSHASSLCSSLRSYSPMDNNSSSGSTSLLHQQQLHRSVADNERLVTPNDATLQLPSVMTQGPRRSDSSKQVRSSKRSTDSIILDSNEKDETGNIARSEQMATNKRMKLDLHHHRQAQSSIGVNELAKSLVSEIALSRDAHLDSNVLSEASKYTESFVQTLFDTALVIARHSNGFNLSDYMMTAAAAAATAADSEHGSSSCQPASLINDDGDDADDDVDGREDPDEEAECYERQSDISVSDLTSALKLLPSKLLKILQ